MSRLTRRRTRRESYRAWLIIMSIMWGYMRASNMTVLETLILPAVCHSVEGKALELAMGVCEVVPSREEGGPAVPGWESRRSPVCAAESTGVGDVVEGWAA